MLALLYAYLIAPRGFRRVLCWFALCFVLVVLVMVVMLFWRVLHTLPEHHGSIFHPELHQPWSPDSMRLRSPHPHRVVKESL